VPRVRSSVPFAHNDVGGRTRTEVRRLTSHVPDRATLERALDTASRAPSLKNRQPWRWHVDAAGVHLYADWRRGTGDGPSGRRDVLMGCGAVLDHCAVALAVAGWRPRIRRVTHPDRTSPLAIVEMVDGPPTAFHQELAAAIPRRRADRRVFGRPTLAPGTLELLHIRAARLEVELSVVPRPRWTRLADGDVALRYGEAIAPPDAQAEQAVMLVLATKNDDDLSRLRAGEALSRVLLSATALGLATCPLTEPLNDARSRVALACEVFDGEAHPQALIRLGVPAPDGEPPMPAPRRSVSETTTWSTEIGGGLPPTSRGYVTSVTSPTSPEQSNENDDVLTIPATPGAEALPSTEDDEGDET
jgi:nitroreductase